MEKLTNQIVSASCQALKLPGITNARQPGGYPAKDGRMIRKNILLRSGTLVNAKTEAVTALEDIYHVRYIIDFRSPDRQDRTPDPPVHGAVTICLDVTPVKVLEKRTAEYADTLEKMEDFYTYLAVGEEPKRAYYQFFRILLENKGGGILVHCYSGKDRTGIAMALLLYALGVEEKIIEEDYLLSNIFLQKEICKAMNKVQAEGKGKKEIESAKIKSGVDKNRLRQYFRVIRENYGTVENYLEKEMGLGAMEIGILKELYTEAGNFKEAVCTGKKQ